MSTLLPSRKLGQFVISADLLQHNPAAAARAIAGMLVLRAEYDFAADGVRIFAWAPWFPEVAHGREAPWVDVCARVMVAGDLWDFGQ